MKKKFLKSFTALLLAVMMVAPGSAFAATFSDVKAEDWYFKSVEKLASQKIVAGYKDNSFKPQNTVTRAEFLKMVMASLDYSEQSKYGEHWVKAWLDKAYTKGLLDESDRKFFNLDSIDQPITRREMAKLAVRSTRIIPVDKNINSYITDFDTIEAEYKDFVKDAFFEGIITGYPDNSFMPYNTLTRAEACVVIDRILSVDARKPPSQTIWEKRFTSTRNFVQPYAKNFVLNESTNTSFIYNSNFNDNPSQEVLSKNKPYPYDFIIDVMTEELRNSRGYDYMITFDPEISDDSKAILNEYLKTIMPYNYSSVIGMGIENMNAGTDSIKNAEVDGWNLKFSNSTGEKPAVMIQISR